MSSDHTFVADVEATVEMHDATKAPRIFFSFPGLQDPLTLWDELRAIGWHVPDRPPAPDAEIDWNAEGARGYAVLPYPVENFEIEARGWPAAEVAQRGLETINTLRRLGVDLQVPVAYLAHLRRNQVSMLRDPVRNKPVAKPTSIPTTLLLSKQPWSALIAEPKVKVYETAAGPSQPNFYWAESELPVDELFSRERDRMQFLRTVGRGWELINQTEVPASVEGRDRILRFVVRDVADGTAMIDQIKGSVSDQVASLIMRPINETDAIDNCLLIIATVPKAQFAEIGQSLISNFSDAIGRGRSYIPLGRENAA